MRMDALSLLSITTKIVDAVTTGTLVCMESAAQLSIGQTILRFIDRFLWIVEKSAQWSLPCQEESTGENEKSFGKMTLVRPLPWVFFLPALILLRALRAGLNVGALILGYRSLEPCEMVNYLQKSRRRLRAIKTNGMKSMRQKKGNGTVKVCTENMSGDAKWKSIQLIRAIQVTLSSLSCMDGSKLSPSPPPTQIKVRMNHESTPTPEEKSTTESASSPMHVESKRKYSEVSSDGSASDDFEDESFHTKLERLGAVVDSLDDDDFSPADLSKSSNASSSISRESSISATEIEELQDEAKIFLHRAYAGVAEIIKEEPEPEKHGNYNERTGQKFENPNTGYASENSHENQDFYSPCNAVLPGEEGDTAFYSPISSKSSSPVRTPPALEQGQESWAADNVAQKANACQNGELNPNLKAQISGAPNKTTNGHTEEKRGNSHQTKINKPNYRGRRTSHASRKKK